MRGLIAKMTASMMRQ